MKKKISQKELGNIIGILWQNHQDFGKKYVASLLHGYAVSKRKVYRYIFQNYGQKPGFWWSQLQNNSSQRAESLKIFDQNTGVGQRKCALKQGVSARTIGRTLKKCRIGFSSTQSTAVIKKQMKEERKCLNKHWRKMFRGKSIVKDDESYFTLTSSNVEGNSGCYSSDRKTTRLK